MPTPSREQIQQFKAYERRQQRYERKYRKLFLSHLASKYNAAAKSYPLPPETDNTQLEKILTRMYTEIILNEAKITYKEVLEPLEGNRLKTKDVIDDLIGILAPGRGGLINIWQSLLNNFLQVRLTNKITQISDTTNERISKIIERGQFEGKGAEQIARDIRRESRAKFNRNRSLVIARTESVVSANQGKYIAAQSSNLQMVKRWQPALDSRTRPSHRGMLDGQWVDLDSDFWLANENGALEPALYPGDPRLSAENTINCRCSLITQVKRDDSGRILRKI